MSAAAPLLEVQDIHTAYGLSHVLFGVSLLPYATRMSGVPYLVAAMALGAAFVHHAFRLYRAYSDALARATFRFSILYLAALFSALLLDHYWR